MQERCRVCVQRERSAMERAVGPDHKRREHRWHHYEDRVWAFAAQNSPRTPGLAGVLDSNRERMTTKPAQIHHMRLASEFACGVVAARAMRSPRDVRNAHRRCTKCAD